MLGIGSTAVRVTLSKAVGYTHACLVARSCPTLCCPMDCSPPGSCIHAILWQESWSGLPFPPPEDPPNPVIETETLVSPTLQADSLPLSHQGSPKLWDTGSQMCTSGLCVFKEHYPGIPWRRKWLPTPVFLPGEFRGQRSLTGCSPWGCKESDMTE